MNAVTAYKPEASGGSFALVPQNIGEAIQLAKIMAENELLPLAFKGKPAHCLMVIEQAGRWRMSPFQVAMGTSLIQNKLMTEGKIIAAAVNTQPGMAARLSYKYDGAGDNRTVTVSGRLQGESEPRTVEVRLGDAKTTNGIWAKQPDQQLAYHGARVWARRHTPEIILGVYAPEEFDESHRNNASATEAPSRVSQQLRLEQVNRAQNIIDHGNRPPPAPPEPNADLGGDGIPNFDADPLRDRVDAAIQAFSAATSLAHVDKIDARVSGLFTDIVAADRADLGMMLDEHIAAVRSRFPAPAIEGMPAA